MATCGHSGGGVDGSRRRIHGREPCWQRRRCAPCVGSQAPVSAGPHSSRSGPAACLRKAGESSTQTAGGRSDLAAQWRCRGGTRSGPQILDLSRHSRTLHAPLITQIHRVVSSTTCDHLQLHTSSRVLNLRVRTLMMLLMWSIISPLAARRAQSLPCFNCEARPSSRLCTLHWGF